MDAIKEIIRAREYAKMNRPELAKAIGITAKYMNDIEKRRSGIKVELLEDIARETGTKLIIAFVVE